LLNVPSTLTQFRLLYSAFQQTRRVSCHHSLSLKMKFSLIIPALVATAFAGPVLKRAPQATTPPNEVTFAGEPKYAGSGCPPGSAAITLSDNNRQLTVLFSSYIAQVGGGALPTEARKNCQLTIVLKYPGGFQYSIFSSQYRGYLQLDEKVTARQKTTYNFSGEKGQAVVSSDFKGPYDESYLISDEVPFQSTVFSPCGRNTALVVNSEISLNNSANRQALGLMTTDSEEHRVIFQTGISWLKCPGTP